MYYNVILGNKRIYIKYIPFLELFDRFKWIRRYCEVAAYFRFFLMIN